MNIGLIIGLISIAIAVFVIYRMLRRANKLIDWLKESLEENGKASAKKISAFVVIFLVIVIHLSWLQYATRNDNYALALEFLISDFSFIATCLGLKAVKEIFDKKYQSKTDQVNPPPPAQ